MRILFVKPQPLLETCRKVHGLIMLEPLEFGYLAAVVPEGHQVRVVDLRLSHKPQQTLVQELQDYRPEMIGISGYTHELSEVKRLSRIIRGLLPEAKVVVGGHHATVLPADYNLDCFDAIVQGEGCAPFQALVQACVEGRAFTGIDNVLVPGEYFDAVAAANLPKYPELSTVPVPRRDLWDPSNYRCIWTSEKHPDWQSLFPPVSLVRTSFGCQMECSFCVVPRLCRRKHMTRDPEIVAEEIAGLHNQHIYFCDDETFINQNYARRLAEAIETHGIDKRYFAWARSTTVNKSPQLFRLWRKIGLDTVFLGFEASSDDELRDLVKHSTVKDNERAHKVLREIGIAVQAGFMVHPNYTQEDFDRLGRYIESMPPAQVTLTVYTPSPGSPAWSQEYDKFIANPIALHDCMHPLTRTVLPLKKFYKRFSSLVWSGSAKNPLRKVGTRVKPLDIMRIWWAAWRYKLALQRAYRDFDKELW
jgi:radical SAM superfamily enzyme YgiQ (UPF0313 family)